MLQNAVLLCKKWFWSLSPLQLNSTRGTEVDNVEEYKNLGVQIDKKMDWTKGKETLYKKGQSWLYFSQDIF